MLKRALILFGCFLLLMGCKGALTLKIRYDRIQGLEAGARVLFEQKQIGKVTEISSQTDGHYLVTVAIRTDFANAVTSNSRFFVAPDPQSREKMAIKTIQAPNGGTPLPDGAVVEGCTETEALLAEFGAGLAKGLEDFRAQVEQFTNDLSRIPESKEFHDLENELNRLLEELNRSGKTAQEKIKKEILPELRKQLERLREQLRAQGREQDLEPLEKDLKHLEER